MDDELDHGYVRDGHKSPPFKKLVFMAIPELDSITVTLFDLNCDRNQAERTPTNPPPITTILRSPLSFILGPYALTTIYTLSRKWDSSEKEQNEIHHKRKHL
jgi:hypothetical protein